MFYFLEAINDPTIGDEEENGYIQDDTKMIFGGHEGSVFSIDQSRKEMNFIVTGKFVTGETVLKEWAHLVTFLMKVRLTLKFCLDKFLGDKAFLENKQVCK